MSTGLGKRSMALTALVAAAATGLAACGSGSTGAPAAGQPQTVAARVMINTCGWPLVGVA